MTSCLEGTSEAYLDSLHLDLPHTLLLANLYETNFIFKNLAKNYKACFSSSKRTIAMQSVEATLFFLRPCTPYISADRKEPQTRLSPLKHILPPNNPHSPPTLSCYTVL